jgi:hypothetical protein
VVGYFNYIRLIELDLSTGDEHSLYQALLISWVTEAVFSPDQQQIV